MDYRKALGSGSILSLNGMEIHIGELVGKGSNAFVYKAWYSDPVTKSTGHHVLVKELFPFDPKGGIRREEDGRILVGEDSRELWQRHLESFEAGNRIHLALLESQPELMAMGSNIISCRHNETLYTVLGYSGGRSLHEELNRRSSTLRQTTARILSVLDALEAFHKSGFLHLDISPDNIMLVGHDDKERIFLIDYNSARSLKGSESGYLSCKPGFSAPELLSGSNAAPGFPADLYSVAAVFYRCLMGRKLNILDTLSPKAPDGSESPLLTDAPQTVRSMVRTILKKGLATLPQRRYQSIDELRQDMQELLDRIDCVGVTHWALWENGRRGIHELISQNPALSYLKDEKQLYPIAFERENGESVSLSAFLGGLCSGAESSALVLGRGGMGKTSALLHSGALLSRRYSPSSPAVFYLSLAPWNGRDDDYIKSRLLMSLRFKKGENNYADALHALHQLLSRPLESKEGERPALILLLDGLNETGHDSSALLREINELSSMAGVCILAASRTEVEGLKLEKLTLRPLDVEAVEEALGKRGLLIPRLHKLVSLMRTPLMLSLYIEAGLTGSLSEIETSDELMAAYMESLLKKTASELPEGAPLLWQADAALNLLLPAIAARSARLGRALKEEELLALVKDCRRALSRPYMRKLFPRWIGHISDILGNTDSAEDWYALMVHSLLWQKLGMLVRYEEGYGIFHQELGEFLEKKYQPLSRARRRSRGLAALAAVCLVSLAVWLSLPRSYDEAAVDEAMENTAASLASYCASRRPLDARLSLFLYGDMDYFIEDYEMISDEMAVAGADMPDMESTLSLIKAMLASGDMMPSSKLSFDGAKAAELLETAQDAQKRYLEYLPLIRAWAGSTEARSRVPGFPMCLKNMMDADELLIGKLYYECLHPHFWGEEYIAEHSWAWRLKDLVYAAYISVPEGGELTELAERQENAKQDFFVSAVSVLKAIEESGESAPISPTILTPLPTENEEARSQAMEDVRSTLGYYDTLISNTLWALDYVDDFVQHNSWESLLKARAACAAAAESYDPESLPTPQLPEDEFRALLEKRLLTELESEEAAADYADTAALAYDRYYYHYSDNDIFSMSFFIQLLECDAFRSATLPILENASAQCRIRIEKLSRSLCARTNSLLYILGDHSLWYALPADFPAVAEGMSRWVSDPIQMSDVDNALYREYFLYHDDQIELVSFWSIASDERQKFMACLEDGRWDEASACFNPIYGAPDCVPAPPWLWERLLPGSTRVYDEVLDIYDYDDLSFLPIYYEGNSRYYTGQLIHAAPEGLVFTVEGVGYDELMEYEEVLKEHGFTVEEKEHILDWDYCRKISRDGFVMEISWFDFACVIDIDSSCYFVPESCLELLSQ